MSIGLPVAWILRSPLYIIALSFHLTTLVLSLATLNSFAVGQILSPSPPLRFTSFMSFCGFWLSFDSCGFFVGCLGEGPSRSALIL